MKSIGCKLNIPKHINVSYPENIMFGNNIYIGDNSVFLVWIAPIKFCNDIMTGPEVMMELKLYNRLDL